MDWKHYAVALLLFNLLGVLVLYLLQRAQAWLPLNPQSFPNVSADSAFNTAVSFVTNTSWQGYAGETTMGYLVQMLGITVQSFLSAASGIAVLLALIRGFGRRGAQTVGNLWVDLTRSTLYILLLLSLLFAVVFMGQGVIQSFAGYRQVQTLQLTTWQQPKLDAQGNPVLDAAGHPVKETLTTQQQLLPMGPVASQESIKLLSGDCPGCDRYTDGSGTAPGSTGAFDGSSTASPIRNCRRSGRGGCLANFRQGVIHHRGGTFDRRWGNVQRPVIPPLSESVGLTNCLRLAQRSSGASRRWSPAPTEPKRWQRVPCSRRFKPRYRKLRQTHDINTSKAPHPTRAQPIMADEARHGPAGALPLAGMRAADVFPVKIVQSGGLTGAASVALIPPAANFDLYGGPMLEGAVWTIGSAQLFSTFSELKWGTELFGPHLLTEEILIEPPRYENFALHLPQGAGRGVTLDWDRIGRLRRDSKRGASVSMSRTAIPHTAFPTYIDPTETQHHEQANDRRPVAEDQRQRHERGQPAHEDDREPHRAGPVLCDRRPRRHARRVLDRAQLSGRSGAER